MDATPKGSESADVSVTPPPGTWANYEVTLCPVAGPSTDCVKSTCVASPANKTCPVTGLNPETTYSAQVIPVKADGTKGTRSNEDIITTPSAPKLTSAEAYGPTAGLATATSPSGLAYTQWRFTATPKSGGTPVVVTSNDPSARLYGLTPNTEASMLRAHACSQTLSTSLHPVVNLTEIPFTHMHARPSSSIAS